MWKRRGLCHAAVQSCTVIGWRKHLTHLVMYVLKADARRCVPCCCLGMQYCPICCARWFPVVGGDSGSGEYCDDLLPRGRRVLEMHVSPQGSRLYRKCALRDSWQEPCSSVTHQK